ncbi:MAG: hypothetical protein II843_00465 [Alphaproteobacteria bacterium]|nr:hypothetical protein [Alphaproteobacteria bacterium]MBQ6012395.1 hypothetical protein [Alphaproteobacteria bacterium]
MQDTKHRNYEYVPSLSKQEQTASDLLEAMMFFIKNTQIKREDWILLNRLLRNLERKKHSAKVLRGIKNRFEKIQNQYQR